MEGHITPTVLLMHAGLKSETSTMIETNPVKNGRPHNTHNYSMVAWSGSFTRGGGPN
jgi:hypothetical protein